MRIFPWINIQFWLVWPTVVLALCFALHGQQRVNSGVQVLYRFQSENNGVLDLAQVGRPLHLKIEGRANVHKRNGAIEFLGKSMVRSPGRSLKIHLASTWTNELTVEAWIEPSNATQNGPARVVSFSRDGSQRNFTLGQDGNRYDFRLRTTTTSDNGIPSVSTPVNTARPDLTHVVYTRDQAGIARVFLNGRKVVEENVTGDFSNWDPNFRLVIGNEHSGDRVWLGKIYLVAIYNRSLHPPEIRQNFIAGKNPRVVQEIDAQQKENQFTQQIAPLLTRHCLECHDSINRKGELDMTTLAGLLSGGESGTALVAGNPQESLIWTSVDSGEMPHQRPPLDLVEKKALRDWIAAGAQWPIKKIDPAIFLRARKVDNRLVRRLTVDEYISAVQVAVGRDIGSEAKKLFPEDLRTDGFNNTAYNLGVDLKHVQAYARLAELITDKLSIAELRSNYLTEEDLNEASLEKLIRKMGKWILRGPLNEAEVQSFLRIGETLRSAGGSFDEATRFILEAMLQSPRFIYLIERHRGDGTTWPIGPFELANRISFILWGSPPDAELFDLAASGELLEKGVLQREVERMLADHRVRKRSKQFIHQWLNLDRLTNLRPNAEKFPKWNNRLADDMRRETLLFFEEVVWNQQRPIAELFDSPFTFLNRRLAEHYRIEGVEGLPREELIKVRLKPQSRRSGILTQGSVLTAGGDEASMVSRGLFVLHDVLRGIVKDPPPCVDTTPVATRSGLTQRAIALERIGNANCGGCHRKFEPLAFGLEKFDGLGRFHDQDEHGNSLREDGQILFPGDSAAIKFRTSNELMKLLADRSRARETVAWKLTQFSLGRPLGSADAEVLETIIDAANKNGFTYQAILKAIIQSELVQTIRTEPYPNELKK